MALRSGFVSIVGRPNAGKSTLLNVLLGQKLAIVTHKPQTTRTRVLGVLEVPAVRKEKGRTGSPAAQIVLVDTPGIHKGSTELDRRMLQEVQDALEGRDVVLFLVDATHRLPRPATERPASPQDRSALSAAEDSFALSLIKRLTCPVLLVLNKIDAVSKAELLPIIAHWSALHPFSEVVPISARKEEGLDVLLRAIVAHLPAGQRYFPRDQITDQPERFLVAEIVREKVLLLTGEEVPHASAVVIERWEEPAPSPARRTEAKPPLVRIAAAIICERTGQKAILIGKGGTMLKQIGTAARKDMEALLDRRVFLELFVKVEPDWRGSRSFVDELDWRRQMEGIAERQARLMPESE